MKKAKKLIETVVLAILIVIVLAIIIFSLFGENMIKTGIENAGSKTLSVPVNLGNLDLSLLRGSVGVENLVVANPQGYELKNLLELQSGNVTTNLKSLMSDTVQIESINLDGINMSIEQKGTTNNLQEILNSIPKSDEPAAEPSEKPAKKLHIKQLRISNVRVNVKLLPLPGKDNTVTLELQPIEMSDLGSDDKYTTAKLAKEVVVAIAKGIAREGANILPADMINSMESSIGQFTEMGKAAMEEGQKAVDEGQKALEEGQKAGKDLLEGAKDLFKTKEE